MEKKRTKRVDRISELPESILHHILSFLPFKEVAQTSVLSKRWERVWRTYPVLKFDQKNFGEYYGCGNFNKDPRRRMNELFNCVVENMCNRHKDMISLIKFKLSLPLFDDREFTSFVNQCVCHAIGCNVNKLELLFGYAVGENWDDSYNLPQVVLFAKSLEILKLERCKLELPRSDLNLSSLRELNFTNVRMDDHMIKNLVSGCPLIEHLCFNRCVGFKNIALFGLPRLDEINLDDNYEVERLDIKSSNVRSLSISGAEEPRPCEINLASCKNITRLELFLLPITDEWLHSLISNLPVLQFLTIFACNELDTIKISSSCLEELNLSQSCSELKIDTPNLRSFEYEGSVAITSISFSAITLSKINLDIDDPNLGAEHYIEFLANFHHFSKALDLKLSKYEDVMVPEELRRTLSSPLSSLELLKLRVPRTQTSIFAKLVDGLLWIAPHTKSISIIDFYSPYELSLKFTYKKQLIHEGETISCCKSHPISCWGHCMEAVDVRFTGRSDLLRYTLKGARIWKKIVAFFDFGGLLMSA